MIKIFGKLRYHWQPELSFSIIYWCLALTPIFIGMALFYENTKISMMSGILFLIFILLIGFGVHRYFVISDTEDILKIYSSIPKSSKTTISGIKKIEIGKHHIKIYSDKWPKGRVFYMRKWSKKYFLDALVINKYFDGEVELLGNSDSYFDLYDGKKKADIKSAQ